MNRDSVLYSTAIHVPQRDDNCIHLTTVCEFSIFHSEFALLCFKPIKLSLSSHLKPDIELKLNR